MPDTTTTSSDLELTPDQFEALINAFEQISASTAEAIAILTTESMGSALLTPSGDVAHGITVEQVQMPAGRPFRASCLCGWTSPIVGARPHAVTAGGEHTRQVTQLVGLGE